MMTMAPTLRSAGIVHQGLFPVEGRLVEHYNRALERVTQRRTGLSSFSIDKRGKSPEIAQELGNDYLQTGTANRYMIVVSPEQEAAGMVDPEFSFDDEAISTLYSNHKSGMSVIARIDGLYGELEDGMRAYGSIEDLLDIRWINVELHTPSGFITKARDLRRRIEALQKNPALLTENKSKHLHEMIDLIKQVGDIRSYPITNIGVQHEVTSFWSTYFGGVHVFKSDGSAMPMKRPTELFSYLTADTRARSEQAVIQHAVVIYDQAGSKLRSNDTTQFIPLQSTQKVINFLVESGLVGYDQSLIDARLGRTEDVALLNEGMPVTEMSREERQMALKGHYDDMPEAWRKLLELRKSSNFESAVRRAPTDVQAMLLVPKENSTKRVVCNLLTKLFPYDYETMQHHNASDLQSHYASAPNDHIKEYIISTLQDTQR